MGTQVVRITDEAVAIIRKYSESDSLTRGIKEMERQLTTSNSKSTTSNSITVTDSYWKTFDEHLLRIPKGLTTNSAFSPANTKIDGCEIKSEVVNGVKHEFIMHPTKGRLPVKNGKIAL